VSHATASPADFASAGETHPLTAMSAAGCSSSSFSSRQPPASSSGTAKSPATGLSSVCTASPASHLLSSAHSFRPHEGTSFHIGGT